MRHRERVTHSESAHVETERWEEDYRNNPEISGYDKFRNLDYTCSEGTEVMDDVVTPRWTQLRQSGGIANNQMVQVVTEIVDDICSAYIAGQSSIRSGSSPNYSWGPGSKYDSIGALNSSAICGGKGGYLATPTCDDQHWIDLALTKAWANVSLDEVQSLVMIGESRKTVLSMIAIFRRLIKVLKSIKKLDGRALKHELTGKELSDRYMELRYALRPLMYDFNGTIAAIKHESSEALSRLTFRGHEHFSDEDSDLRNFANGTGANGGARSFDCERTSSISFDVRAGVLTQLQTVSQIPVWGLTSVMESAWELVPFSFIVDWFINAGNTIASWTPDYGLTTLASWTVSKKIVEKTFRITRSYAALGETTSTVHPAWHVNQLNNCYCSETVITTTRTPDPSRPILPTLNVNLDVLKLTDLLIIAKHFAGR
jgi:hypothetical protein